MSQIIERRHFFELPILNQDYAQVSLIAFRLEERELEDGSKRQVMPFHSDVIVVARNEGDCSWLDRLHYSDLDAEDEETQAIYRSSISVRHHSVQPLRLNLLLAAQPKAPLDISLDDVALGEGSRHRVFPDDLLARQCFDRDVRPGMVCESRQVFGDEGLLDRLAFGYACANELWKTCPDETSSLYDLPFSVLRTSTTLHGISSARLGMQIYASIFERLLYDAVVSARARISNVPKGNVPLFRR